MQKLHYEHLGGLLIRRDGLLHWKCPDCKKWGGSEHVMATCPHCGNIVKAKPAIEPVKSPPTIAQTIRDAAINRPQFLGDVECGVLDAFCDFNEWHTTGALWRFDLRNEDVSGKYHARTFMLLVAEALE